MKKSQSFAFRSSSLHDSTESCELLCETHLDDVEDNILVEAVQDTLGYTVVIPSSVDEQQILQVFELRGREVNEGRRQDE